MTNIISFSGGQTPTATACYVYLHYYGGSEVHGCLSNKEYVGKRAIFHIRTLLQIFHVVGGNTPIVGAFSIVVEPSPPTLITEPYNLACFLFL